MDYVDFRRWREDELYHHGVLGQKWGVRRYQNPDGSYTQKGLERYRRRLAKNGATIIAKGSELYRVSKQKKSDATEDGRLYVDADAKEHEVYKHSIGASDISESGKAFVQKYIAKEDLVIPSIRKQTKIELDLLKDSDVQREMVESLMSKGMSREEATKQAKPFNAGITFLKNSPWILTTPITGIGIAMPFMITAKEKQQKLDLIRNTVGDENAKELTNKLRKNLEERGYNAYRDTNDRRRMNTKNAIIVFNSAKNTKLSDAHELTREEFGRAYANRKQWATPRITKTVSEADLRKDGEAAYDRLKEDYIVSRHNRQSREAILKKYKKELK